MRDPFHREPKATKTSLGFMTDLVDDITPQLGGDLDCNGHKITSPTDPADEHGVGDRGYNDIRYTQTASDDLSSYKIPTGSAVVIEAFKQLFIADEYIIEGTGVLTINGSGLLAVY